MEFSSLIAALAIFTFAAAIVFAVVSKIRTDQRVRETRREEHR